MKTSMRARFRTAAAIIAAAAQVVLCSASLLEVRFGPDARAHVEAGGVHLHHAHDDTDCAACTGRHLLASSQLEAPARPALIRSAPILRIDYTKVTRDAHRLDPRSRAPPAFPV